MKKSTLSIVLLLALFFVGTRSFSQIRFGAKGALNFANLDYDGKKGDVLLAPQAGLVVYSNLEKALFLQSGLLYNVKGSKADFVDTKMTFHFLEIPVNLGYQIGFGENIKLSPYAGLYGGFAISGKAKVGSLSVDIFDDEFTELTEEETMDRLDYGGNVGLGLHMNQKVILSGQYSFGFKEINDSDTKTKTISLGLTFLF